VPSPSIKGKVGLSGTFNFPLVMVIFWSLMVIIFWAKTSYIENPKLSDQIWIRKLKNYAHLLRLFGPNDQLNSI